MREIYGYMGQGVEQVQKVLQNEKLTQKNENLPRSKKSPKMPPKMVPNWTSRVSSWPIQRRVGKSSYGLETPWHKNSTSVGIGIGNEQKQVQANFSGLDEFHGHGQMQTHRHRKKTYRQMQTQRHRKNNMAWSRREPSDPAKTDENPLRCVSLGNCYINK